MILLVFYYHPYQNLAKISIFDAKHQKYKQFVPSSIIGSQIPNLRRWRDVGGM